MASALRVSFPFVRAILFVLLGTGGAPILAGQTGADVTDRVLYVRVNRGTRNEATATAFVLDVDKRQYLITAKHVVGGFHDDGSIDLFENGVWVPLSVKIFRCDDPVDIAILVAPQPIPETLKLSFGWSSLLLGQDLYFLGFPYGLYSPASARDKLVVPMVKRAILSGMEPAHVELKLDGYNNPGFSGGPITEKDPSATGCCPAIVVGVVSGFIPEVVPVMREHDIASAADAGEVAKDQPWRIRQKADGTFFEYVDTGEYTALNTGIVIGYLINPAIALIRQHPIGPVVP